MLSRISFNAAKGCLSRLQSPAVLCAVRSSVCNTGTPAAPATAQAAAPTAASTGDSNEFTWYAKSGTKFPWEGPERDVVNFPRPIQPVEPGKTRFLFVPEEWFTFFYNKTGVTGPYVLGFTVFNYVMSKELWIIDHEYYYCYAALILFAYSSNKFGDKIAKYLDSELEKENAELKALDSNAIKDLEDAIKLEKKHQWQAEGQTMLIDAKRENVAMQQEAIYRERAMTVYNDVRKRLEFHSQKQIMERRVAQKHMCNWIVQQVLKSITPQQEQDTLRKCIVDLKSLSSRA